MDMNSIYSVQFIRGFILYCVQFIRGFISLRYCLSGFTGLSCVFQVIVMDMNTQFIENVIFIMKNILEMKSDQPCEYLGLTSIESLMLTIVRYKMIYCSVWPSGAKHPAEVSFSRISPFISLVCFFVFSQIYVIEM